MPVRIRIGGPGVRPSDSEAAPALAATPEKGLADDHGPVPPCSLQTGSPRGVVREITAKTLNVQSGCANAKSVRVKAYWR